MNTDAGKHLSLMPNNPTTAKFYHLPKVHSNLSRPIISSYGAPHASTATCKIPGWIKDLIKTSTLGLTLDTCKLIISYTNIPHEKRKQTDVQKQKVHNNDRPSTGNELLWGCPLYHNVMYIILFRYQQTWYALTGLATRSQEVLINQVATGSQYPRKWVNSYLQEVIVFIFLKT